jgi:hypothetical protein
MTVPGGGLQELTDEFPFHAPDSGYQPFVEIDMPTTLGEAWKDKVSHSYFLKLGTGAYGRIEFEMIPYGENFVLLKSYLNPTGSRELEGDANIHFARFSK